MFDQINTTGLRSAAIRFPRRFVGMLSFFLLPLAGCTVGPDYRRPDAPPVGSFTRQPTQATPSGASGDVAREWWKAYESPHLNALVEQALRRNPSIEAGTANLRAAQEMVNAQRGVFYPSVQAGYNAARQNSGNVIASPLSSNTTLFNLHTAQLNVGFVPDVFGGNRRQVESLQASASGQRYQLEALKITLASNVVAAAIQERQLTEQIGITENAIRLSAEQLRQLKGLQTSGYSSGLDVAQQQVAYVQTVALLPPLQKQIEQTRNLLAVLCGEFPERALPGATPDDIHVPATLPTILPSSLIERRPDVQAAQEQLHASHAQIGVAVANLLPQVSLAANLAYSNNILAGLLSNANRSWALLGGLTQPLFAGGALSARKREAEASAEAAFSQYQYVVLTAFQNVADTLYALEADDRSLAAARDLESANQHLVEHSQRQLEQGYVSRLVFLAAQQSLLQAQLTRVVTKATYLSDTAALYQALGGGWNRTDTAASLSLVTPDR